MASRLIIPKTAFPATSRRTKRIRIEDADHLAFIRSLPCVVTGYTNEKHLIEAAHVSYADLRYGKLGRGKGTKEDDCWTVPLWTIEHAAQHALGDERRYWREHGIDPCRIALALWRCRTIGDYETALLVIERAKDL